MPTFPEAEPSKLLLDPDRLGRLWETLERWTANGEVPAVSVCVGRGDGMIRPRLFGRQRPGGEPIRSDARFLVASITKPITAIAVMKLIEQGRLSLDDRVAEIVPEFGQNAKNDVQVRHLLTHTSGLPDMLPENKALRNANAGLAQFVAATCRQSLFFPPGSGVRYQSMGFAILAEIVQRVEGRTLAESLRIGVFEPLGMNETSLGACPDVMERVAVIRLSPEQGSQPWNWNSCYWLAFGAPWGGLITTAADLTRLGAAMLGGGRLGSARVLSPASVRVMTTNALAAMPEVPEEERRCRPWGLGWRLAWPGNSANFGDLLGTRAYGHWGATGTLFWVDPDTAACGVILTTLPQGDEGRYLVRASNLLASAVM
jgi:CubicO group peptidase (beta-lactamase class C family)